MKNYKFTILALLSIGDEITDEINFDVTFKEFSSLKAKEVKF